MNTAIATHDLRTSSPGRERLPSSPPSPLTGAYAPSAVAFLEEIGAGRVRHSHRTLLDHLVGVAAILERWGARDEVCVAGLFHSIYGTEHFKEAVLSVDERERVTRAIGDRAERLAYVFCAFDRTSLCRAVDAGPPYAVDRMRRGRPIPVTLADVGDLVWLVWANAMEQMPYMRTTPEGNVRSRRAFARVEGFLSDEALHDLRLVYGT